ncbi:SDR family oxidoreductase [Aliifodinibius sp. S!AR15-10]|uniref:SDR family NAD(P)-dependent oxidoreductase n=1 Tax=Aliifodinibius sp. S!AR15-10 TaxID=2950437 RepID=UPI0028613055|nr:SDR family oxidoreductase [Aliifodinibius sp. S!AR15-10]MDR8390383.1 SDR family oxidoreductase [Aliifodinibius sp. S!AR15-10]
MRLKEKVIIITGSTMGIGKAIALRCAREGARVVINGLEENLGEELVTEIGKEQAVAHIEDLTSDGAAQRLVDCALKKYGKLDGLVNNAAMVASSNIHTTDLEFLENIFQVNTYAPFQLIKSALPYLSKTDGSVLNIGSVNAWSGEPDLLAYSMSKGALMTMTRNLGDTLMREEGIRVNQINPGWVLTEKEIERKRAQNLDENWYTQLPETYAPAGRILQPEEIASAAVYWLSDECGPVSGQVMELEQYPLIGRNPPKDETTIPKREE